MHKCAQSHRESLKAEVLSQMHQRDEPENNDERYKALDLPLLPMKIEEGGHKPGNVLASRSWEWPSADSRQGNRDLSPKTTRI